MQAKFEKTIMEVLDNIEKIHQDAEMTMDSRKEKHNLDDNSKFKNIQIEEKNMTIIKNISDINTPEKNRKDILDIIKCRKSIRDYSEKSISIEEFFELIKYSFGYRDYETGIYGFQDFPVSYTPSAGGLACVSHYIIVRNVTGLDKGLYRYNRVSENLEYLSKGNFYYKLPQFLFETGFAQNSAFIVLLYADMNKIAWKYGERGYRFAHLDAGVLAQNLHLLAMKYSIGSCMIAGYQDNEIRKIFSLGQSDIPMLVMTFGYPGTR
ncbi:SagB/ThcOx family dehydrogenase [Enterococcus faecium]|uniref:Nitroreductase domain-containing protein n=1 Tax=Enterococcus faecium TaxID=1352 RepID=A0A242ASC3_ENTFC|nr:SagB/ThcOx family dehydrogenase [Enterococcus faecium]OTN83646.1 hypothetical protein A5810_003127 [Enterococcus faecium]